MASLVTRGRGRRTINEINMVPFIDVMLVLLIIFMVTAPLITPSMIDLPSIGKAGRQPDEVLQVLITKSAALELKGQLKGQAQTQSVTLDGLAQAVRAMQGAQGTGNTAVVISADRSVQYEQVVKVMDKLQRAGIARVGLSVQMTN